MLKWSLRSQSRRSTHPVPYLIEGEIKLINVDNLGPLLGSTHMLIYNVLPYSKI